MKEYAIYLRKSREDKDAPGEVETLARHEKLLLDYAHKNKLFISKIYREVVSGETIDARPEMKRLLDDVEASTYEGVLVVEVERLARGNTRDQGIVSDIFQFSNTKIITPLKTYDPNNEFDEEYFEFGLFMSRREYKTINRRIQRGRVASLNEGKYIASTAPFGYQIERIKGCKGYTLSIDEKKAKIVKLIFDLYINGYHEEDGTTKQMGLFSIAKYLDNLGVAPIKSEHWSTSSLRDIIQNITYTGKVRWKRRVDTPKLEDGKRIKVRIKQKDYLIFDGLHEAIIDDLTFQKANDILNNKHNTNVVSNKQLKNPLTKLVYCAKCGRLMTRGINNKKQVYDTLYCPNRYCDNVSSPMYLVESKIIEALSTWITQYQIELKNTSTETNNINKEIYLEIIKDKESEVTTIQKQLDKAYSLLEQEVYTVEIFKERSNLLNKQLQEANNIIAKAKRMLLKEENVTIAKETLVPEVINVIEAYKNLSDARLKNELLRTVLEKVTYKKDAATTKNKRDAANIEINIFPKLPKH